MKMQKLLALLMLTESASTQQFLPEENERDLKVFPEGREECDCDWKHQEEKVCKFIDAGDERAPMIAAKYGCTPLDCDDKDKDRIGCQEKPLEPLQCGQEVDFVVALDVSGSMHQSGYDWSINAIGNLAKQLDQTLNKLSVMYFGNKVHFAHHFTQPLNMLESNLKRQKFKWDRYDYTHNAFAEAQSYFKKNSKADTKKVLILVSDGHTEDYGKADKFAETLRNDGVHVMTLWPKRTQYSSAHYKGKLAKWSSYPSDKNSFMNEGTDLMVHTEYHKYDQELYNNIIGQSCKTCLKKDCKDWCNTPDCSDYVGELDTTYDGKKCTNWDKGQHEWGPTESSTKHNHCRATLGMTPNDAEDVRAKRLWCYTSDIGTEQGTGKDSKEEWGYCLGTFQNK